MATKLKCGETGTYAGIMMRRRGQAISILGDEKEGTVPVLFPDGMRIRIAAKYVERSHG
jgi:hypothetical protein